MPTFVASVTFDKFFVHELADTGSLATEASAIKKHKTTIDNAYTNTQSKWAGLAAAVEMPDEELLTDAFSTNCEGFSQAAGAALNGVGAALETFGTSVATFKTDTYDPLVLRVDAFNALPEYEFAEWERTAAEKEGNPISTAPTRTQTDRYDLVSDLRAANTAYKKLVDTCVSAIGEAAPQTPGGTDAKALTDALTNIKKAWDFAKTWVDRGGDLVNFGGKLAYVWKADAPSVAKVVLGLLPGWVSQFDGVKEMVGKWFRPTSGPFNYTKYYVPRYGDIDIPKRAQSYWAGIDWKYTTTTTKDGVMSWNGLAVSNINTPAWMTNFMGKAEKAQEWMKKVSDSKAFKFADKALTVVDAGMTYYDKYQEGYNQALKDGVPPSEARSEALWTAGIEGTSKTVGKVAGGYVGRAAGAAIGQALIPIPGVGAAVGGFVGGFIGEEVGGFIGEKVGGFINDWRRDGIGQAWNNVVDDTKKAFSDAGTAVSNGVKAVGDGLANFGKKLIGWKW